MKKQLLVSICGFFFFASLLFGQFETSEVLGTVTDPSGGAVSKATVTLTNQGTGIELQTATDENGNYDFLNVKVGRYSLTVEQSGFSKFTTDVRVDVGARQRVDAKMEVGVITESVVVSSAAAMIQTSDPPARRAKARST
jgi:2',3'-cyclic-nucleotide 2'-phosphodiesterase (5'-nucleotidase family)